MKPKVTVIGGALIDVYAYPHHSLRMHDSNPGYVEKSMGGVGRNIAENLARLEVDVDFLTVLGDDADGQSIIAHGEALGMHMITRIHDKTPTYIAIMDEHHEDVVSIAAADALNRLDAAFILKHIDTITSSDLVVIDTNLEESCLMEVIKSIDRPIYIDAISSQKAIKLKTVMKHIHCLKLNVLEAEILTGIAYESPDQMELIGNQLLAMGLKSAYITMGKQGAIEVKRDSMRHMVHAADVIYNTSGAGDAFFAGVIYAQLHGLDPLRIGLANATINLSSKKAVSEELTKERLMMESKKIVKY